MKRSDYWQLTVKFWAHVPADVRPYEWRRFSDDGPGAYRPSTFDFMYPPTRADFLSACDHLPWTSVWSDSLLPVVAANDWPLVPPGYKSSSVSLVDSAGRIVGELDVSHYDYFRNPYAPIHDFSGSDVDSVVCRLREAKREDARRVIRNRTNYIRETLSNPDNTLAAVQIIRKLLREAGILGNRKAAA